MATYRNSFGPSVDFYKAALMYLAYTPIETINLSIQQQLAVDLCVAAITSEEIFNFGEVVATPILISLRGTQNEWLLNLVHCLNDGDVHKFSVIMNSSSESSEKRSVLMKNQENIKEKLILLSIMNLVFSRASHDRNITFQDVAKATELRVNEVEWALMKALSLGLIRGIIDEIHSTIQVTWVQPRVLSKQNLQMISQQLDGWTDRVKETLLTVEDLAAEL